MKLKFLSRRSTWPILWAAWLMAFPLDAARGDKPSRGPFQFGGVIYQMPAGAGWERGHHKGHVAIYNFDLDPSIVIELHRGERTERDIERWLAERMKASLDDDERVKKSMPVNKKEFGKRQVAMSGQILNGGQVQLHAALRVGDRLEHVFAVSQIDEASAARFSSTFTEFLGSLKFVGDDAKPLMSPPRPGPLEGIYYSSRMSYGIGGLETAHDFYFFSKAGWFFEGVPESRSLSVFDPATAFLEEPRDCGAYELSGKKLVLRFASGDREELDFETDGDGLKLGDRRFQRVDPPADGARIEGTFSTIRFASFTPGSGVVGGVGGGGYHSFKKDGTYETDRWSTAFGNFESAAGDHQGGFSVGNSKNEKRGVYEIKDGLLKIKLSTGETSVQSILLVGDAMLFLDGGVYLDRSKTGD